MPGPVAGGKQQQPRDSERASGRWMNLLFSIVQGLGHTLPLNLRKPLIVHSMHTGMNSFRMFFRMAGIEVQDVVGAEKKDHARGFVKRNSLEPEHFYTDTADMFENCSARDEVGYCRADIFASGFPCQPFSRMSRRSRPPQDHPLYKEFAVVCKYIKKTEPKTCILENVVAFVLAEGGADSGDDLVEEADDGLHTSSNSRNSNRTGITLLREELGDKYHIVHSMVNLSDWTDSRRPRVFIWCLHKNCGSEEVAFAARSLASDIGCQRRRTQPEAVEQHVHIAGTPEWFSVMCDVGNRGKSNSHKLEQKRAWEPEVLRVRELIIQAGRPWAHEHPLAAAKLQGLAGTERQRAVLEAVLLIHCHLNNLDPRDAKQLNLAKRGLKWDISQNVHHSNYGALRHCVCSCLCTGALLYSFEADRLVHPGEILSSFGWPADVECKLMHWKDIQDLAGESQALQAIGVVTTALILSYQKACGW